MNENLLKKPSIVIDGQNVAGDSKNRQKKGYDWNIALQCAKHHHNDGSDVYLIIPCWVKKELPEEMAQYAKLIPIYIGKDPSLDDRQVLGLTAVEDGFYVSNDKKMSKHSKGDLLSRTWCNDRRIEYTITADGEYIPQYPPKWHSRK